MDDDRTRRVIRDLPPAVETPDLPGAGGPRRRRPPAAGSGRAAAEPRRAPARTRRTGRGTGGDGDR